MSHATQRVWFVQSDATLGQQIRIQSLCSHFRVVILLLSWTFRKSNKTLQRSSWKSAPTQARKASCYCWTGLLLEFYHVLQAQKRLVRMLLPDQCLWSRSWWEHPSSCREWRSYPFCRQDWEEVRPDSKQLLYIQGKLLADNVLLCLRRVRISRLWMWSSHK